MATCRMIELFRHAVLVACLASLAIGVLASATMTLVQKSRTGLFRKLGNCNGVAGLSLLAVAMLFNGYPTYADKRRSGSAEEQARQSVRPEPEPSRTGTVCGDDDCTFGVRSAMDPDEAPEFGVWTNALETVRITGIAVGQTSVWMRVSCPGDAPVPSGMLDVFSARDCNADTWTPCGAVSVPASTNEVVIEAFLPGATTATHPRQFFRVGTKFDSDSDGLTDAFEHLVSHTSPSAFDTDGDGIPDGWEYENGLDPNLWPDAYADPDGDGIPNLYEFHNGTQPQVADAWEIDRIVAGGSGLNAVATLSAALAASRPYSVIEVADGIYEGAGWSGHSVTLPDYPVLITSSDCGRSRRAVIRHKDQFAAMYLNAAQTTHTVVQGLCYDLAATNGMQMAFWCGGNLPWSGSPAGGMFRDIYIRMPNPGVEYEGWFFRHYESNKAVIASCTVNACGATSARGIYAVDSPPMSVENCTFVNFPSNDAGLGYGVQYESTAANWGDAPDIIPLEIVNCLFDASFTNAYALAPLENGAAYDVSMLNCIVPSPLEYEADYTTGLIVTNAGVSPFGHIPEDSPACGAGLKSLFAPLDIDGQVRPALPDVGADQFVPEAQGADTDGDGIPDADEEWIYGTDPYFADSDWDGSPDNAEIAGGTDPLNRLSHLARVALSVTNISGTANLTNYFGFSSTPAGWDVTNACAAAHWGQTSIVVSETAGLYGKAFSDLNRNGVYDEDADVIQVVRLESEHVIVNAKITLGDVDGDGVADVTELAEGTNPYDPDSILIHSTIVITDRDAQHGITNFVSHFVSETSAVPAAINMFTSPTYYYPVAASAIDGKIYVRGFRDLDRNGVYDVASDGVFSYVLTASNNGRTIDIDIGDSDGDTIYDSVELSEGTSPTDRQNYCFNCEFEILDVFSPTNELLAEVTFGSNCLYGPVVQTNSTLSLNLGHLVTANGDQVVVTFWEDEDGNGQHDKGEASTAHRIAVQSHDMIYSSRLALGGFDSNHDGLPDWWQAIHNLQSGGYDDDDGDGLINLHEWWSGTDPCVPDGSNTVLSVAARSIDSRIDDRSPGMSQEIYQSYAENGHEGLFVRNDARWTFGIDTSCASPWHDGIGRHSDCAPTNTTVTAISKRHVIYANHFAYAMSTNLVYYFCGTDGSVITNRLVSFSGIAGDIGVGLLEHELPDTVTPAKFLPDDFEDYIVDGRYLPSLIIDQNEKAFVAELSSFTTYRTRGSLHSNIASRNGNRAAFAKNYIGGDSSSPRFLVVGNDVVILGTIWRGGPGSGCLAHLYRQEIQARMNQLCPGYSISEIDFSSYDKTNFRKGDCHD